MRSGKHIQLTFNITNDMRLKKTRYQGIMKLKTIQHLSVKWQLFAFIFLTLNLNLEIKRHIWSKYKFLLKSLISTMFKNTCNFRLNWAYGGRKNIQFHVYNKKTLKFWLKTTTIIKTLQRTSHKCIKNQNYHWNNTFI